MRIDLNLLETGDLLLYSGNKGCFSEIIEYWTKSIYSHVAIILKNPTYIDPKLVGLYILESSYEETGDAIDNKKKFGVQIQSLSNVFKECQGKIFWRKLNCERNSEFYLNINNIYKEVQNKRYDINPIDWIKAAFHIDIGNIHRINTFWCSALVSYIYVNLGLLPKDIPWSLISPVELSSSGDLNNKFLNSNLELEKLIFQKNDKLLF